MNLLRLASRARFSLHRPTLGFLQRRPLAVDDRRSYPVFWGCVRGTTSSAGEVSDRSPQNDLPLRGLLDLERTIAVEVAMGGVLLLRFQTDDGKFGRGSGFVFSDDGLVATSADTFGEMKQGRFKIRDVVVGAVGGKKCENITVSPLGLDTGSGLAIFKLPENFFNKYVKYIFNLSQLDAKAGDSLYMIGHPYAGPYSARFSVVSHPRRLVVRSRYPIRVPNPSKSPLFFYFLESCLVTGDGSTGAPCMNSSGEVVAVHQSSYNTPRSGFWSCGVPTTFLIDLIKWVKGNKSSTIFVHGDGFMV